MPEFRNNGILLYRNLSNIGLPCEVVYLASCPVFFKIIVPKFAYFPKTSYLCRVNPIVNCKLLIVNYT